MANRQSVTVSLDPFHDGTPALSFAAPLFHAVDGLRRPTARGAEILAHVEAMAGAFAASGASVAALCAPDATYAEQGQAMVEALRKAGAKKVLMAGRPAKGGGGPAADAHIFAGCDIVSALRALQADLGIGAA